MTIRGCDPREFRLPEENRDDITLEREAEIIDCLMDNTYSEMTARLDAVLSDLRDTENFHL